MHSDSAASPASRPFQLAARAFGAVSIFAVLVTGFVIGASSTADAATPKTASRPASTATATHHTAARHRLVRRAAVLGRNPALIAGEPFQFSFSGFRPGSTVNVRLDRSSKVLTHARVNSRGLAIARVLVPATLGGGQHHLRISAGTQVALYPFTIEAGIG